MGNEELYNTFSDCFVVGVVIIVFYAADVDVVVVVDYCFPKGSQ